MSPNNPIVDVERATPSDCHSSRTPSDTSHAFPLLDYTIITIDTGVVKPKIQSTITPANDSQNFTFYDLKKKTLTTTDTLIIIIIIMRNNFIIFAPKLSSDKKE